MQALEKIIKRITGIVSILSYAGFLFIMLLTVCDILLRLFTKNSILGAYEIVERVMVCAVFASFAYTQTEHGHVQITLLTGKYPRKLRLVMTILNDLLSIVASIMVAYAAYRQGNVALSSHYTTGVLLIPLYPFYWVEIVSMVVLALAFLLEAVKNTVGLFNSAVADELDTWIS